MDLDVIYSEGGAGGEGTKRSHKGDQTLLLNKILSDNQSNRNVWEAQFCSTALLGFVFFKICIPFRMHLRYTYVGFLMIRNGFDLDYLKEHKDINSVSGYD